MQSRHYEVENIVSEFGERVGKNNIPVCYEYLVEVGFSGR